VITYHMQEKPKTNVDKFKELIQEMHRGFPNWKYYNVEAVIPKNTLDRLHDDDIIVHSYTKDEHGRNLYSLGSVGVQLVSSWNNEDAAKETTKLTSDIKFLTKVMIGATIALWLLALLPIIQQALQALPSPA